MVKTQQKSQPSFLKLMNSAFACCLVGRVWFTRSMLIVALLSPAGTSFALDMEHNHALGIFFGVIDADHDTENVWGVEYEYRISTPWGVGVTYENADDAADGEGVTSKIAMGYYHPDQHWRFGVGVGKEEAGGHSETLTRIGASYDFHLQGFGVAPNFSFDRVDGESVNVYGIAVTWSF